MVVRLQKIEFRYPAEWFTQLLTAPASAVYKILHFGMDMEFVRCEDQDKLFLGSIFFHFKILTCHRAIKYSVY